jgi:hypothetical protein
MFENITAFVLPVAVTFIGLGLLYMVFQSRLKHLETKLDTLCTVVNDEVSQRQQLIERFSQPAPQAPTQTGSGAEAAPIPGHPVTMDISELQAREGLGLPAGDAEESDIDEDSDSDSDADSDDGDESDTDSDDGLDEVQDSKIVYESDADADMIDVSDDEEEEGEEEEDANEVVDTPADMEEAAVEVAPETTRVTVEDVSSDLDEIGNTIDVSAEPPSLDIAEIVAPTETGPLELELDISLDASQPEGANAASPQEFDAAVGQEREASEAAVEEGADDVTEYHEPEKHDIESMTEKEMRKLPVAYMRDYMVARGFSTAAEAKAMRKPEVVNFLMSKRS